MCTTDAMVGEHAVIWNVGILFGSGIATGFDLLIDGRFRLHLRVAISAVEPDWC
jgi:hypothetical protein